MDSRIATPPIGVFQTLGGTATAVTEAPGCTKRGLATSDSMSVDGADAKARRQGALSNPSARLTASATGRGIQQAQVMLAGCTQGAVDKAAAQLERNTVSASLAAAAHGIANIDAFIAAGGKLGDGWSLCECVSHAGYALAVRRHRDPLVSLDLADSVLSNRHGLAAEHIEAIVGFITREERNAMAAMRRLHAAPRYYAGGEVWIDPERSRQKTSRIPEQFLYLFWGVLSPPNPLEVEALRNSIDAAMALLARLQEPALRQTVGALAKELVSRVERNPSLRDALNTQEDARLTRLTETIGAQG